MHINFYIYYIIIIGEGLGNGILNSTLHTSSVIFKSHITENDYIAISRT